MADKLRIICWGTGNTAKQYISEIKELSKQFEVVAFTDGRLTAEEEHFWEGYRVVTPEMVRFLNIDYICILSVWEWEIRKRIYDENLFDLERIISFHEICMMDSFGMILDNCYKKILHSIHPRQKYSANMWMLYEELKRKYAYVLCDNKYWKTSLDRKVYFEENVRPIWVLWLQGFEQAPKLVRVCTHSLQRALGDKECICLLDETNLMNYIDLPDYILQKWKAGHMSNAHFSDLVRLRLLNVYAGVWIDATVYFTGNELPDYIKRSELFLFNIREAIEMCAEPKIAANWLIAAQPANKLLIILEALLHEYWKKEDEAVNYYFFHIFWTLVTECFPKEWRRVERIIRDPAQLLNGELTHEFHEGRFECLKRMTDIHKLSYKGAYAESGKNSFWAKICEIEGE